VVLERPLALMIAVGLLAGCSDPAGAARREQAAARKRSPSPTPSSAPRAQSWWQAPRTTHTVGTLRVRTGALHPGARMKIIVTDLGSHASRLLTVSTRPHGALVGHYALTRIRVVAKSGRYGVGFRYRTR
jgi:hypothetical protein